MKKRKTKYEELNINQKIQYLIWSLALPLLFCILLLVASMCISIGNYSTITHNMNLSSEFSLSFKENMDLKMYHYCVGSAEQKTLPVKDVNRAIRLAEKLEKTTVRKESRRAIELVIADCKNLKKRMRAIAETKGYDSRQIQLTNNVYVLTELTQKAMGDYIYYEAGYLKKVENDMFARILAVGIILGIFVFVIVALVVKKSFRLAGEITDPIGGVSDNVRKVGHGNFDIIPVETNVIEVKELDRGILKMAGRIQTLLENVKEEERKQHMIQLELLQAQVNPHFLYNTLDTIVWMVEADMHDEAIEMLTHLSVFFRTVLSKGEDVISLHDEVLHTKSYLEIQQIRYSDILDYTIELPQDMEEIRLPKMTLQPLVENALYHGVKEKRGKSSIWITFEDAGRDIVIQVKDDGIGMTEDRLREVQEGLKNNQSVGFGMSAVEGRLKLYYGEEYGLDICSKYQEGTVIRVNIPKKFNFSDKKTNKI
ncbi:sensor histidine kinase [Jutongia huaianensis]|uniref:histidine kinase n=1 Tax=Jutongia huaianensis TaxID=2763668 RepID=A0ABR7N2E3_9FIRM|nr:sensor histidine kinase [Jutongia huaianensis]